MRGGCEDVEMEIQEIWTKAMELEAVTKKDFDRFCQIALFELSIHDKNRPGVYSCIKNQDYAQKLEVYIPREFEGNDYDLLPEGHKLYKKPTNDAKPSCYEIRLHGDEGRIKNKQRQTVVMNLRVFEILEKFE